MVLVADEDLVGFRTLGETLGVSAGLQHVGRAWGEEKWGLQGENEGMRVREVTFLLLLFLSC